ncbi:MAG: nucleotidyltransferase family protein, partial [Gemmatimonadetes bacterium]|nr:nucleotidyltransferase family protein [Gemmatimonadota bacterium]
MPGVSTRAVVLGATLELHRAVIPPVLAELFAALQDADIPYVVLRGYAPVSEMAESMDVDVFIAPADRKRTTVLLEQIGWFERQFQGGRFPHRFYDDFRLPSRVCTMLDVVYGLYYGEELHELIGADRVLATSMLSDGFRVPHPWLAMFTFALHVLLDKAQLSAPNEVRARALHAI